MLTGSLASAYHGAGRSTMDIDLVVDPTVAQLSAFVAALPSDRFYVSLDAALEARERESLFNVVDTESGWKVDLIIRKSRPFSRTEFDRRVAVTFDEVPIAVATVEDVIISKLEWAALGGSARQLEDVAALLRIRGPDLDDAYLARWIGELGLSVQWEAARHLAER
jgi:nucleotidyltransferase AbiEii toxin of type IV toxin-antitoxin system